MNSTRRPALGGDVDHPNTKRINPPRHECEEDEEPTKDEPTPPKSSPQTKQVWKEKVTSSESPSQEVQPSRSSSPGLTDAPKE